MELTEENLKGKIFGRWQVLRFSHKVKQIKYFVCKCLDCGQEKTVAIQNVTRGLSKSCGCISHKEVAYNINKLYNEFDIVDGVVHVYLNNDRNKVMLCDVEDWEQLKDCYWCKHNGYSFAIKNYNRLLFHRCVMGVSDPKIQVDHINGNRADNRKSNLRICTNQENSMNRYKNSNNTSGYKGVVYDKERKKWRACIEHNGKRYSSPKRYNTPEEAYEWYKEKSNELFGEYSVFQSRTPEEDYIT